MSEKPIAEKDAIKERVEHARLALNAVPWWRPIKRQNAALDYKYALLRGAYWEIDHCILPPDTGRMEEDQS